MRNQRILQLIQVKVLLWTLLEEYLAVVNNNCLLVCIGAAQVTSLGLYGNYSIPSTNPFVGVNKTRGEIYALGLRNPWRCSFDSQRPTYFYCADVGQVKLIPFQLFTYLDIWDIICNSCTVATLIWWQVLGFIWFHAISHKQLELNLKLASLVGRGKRGAVTQDLVQAFLEWIFNLKLKLELVECQVR